MKQLSLNSTVPARQTGNVVTTEGHDDTTLKSSGDYADSLFVDYNKQYTTTLPSINYSSISQPTDGQTFSAMKDEDAGQWLDHILAVIEQTNLNPCEQRDLAAGKLRGEALLWYRMNRLQIPDMQTFIHQFLLTYNPPMQLMSANISTSKETSQTNAIAAITTTEKHIENTAENTSKLSDGANQNLEFSFQNESSWKVLQSAKNDKVKMIPIFSGSENSANWLKSLEQAAKSLRLNDLQVLELATIKLSGPAQEWYYHQDSNISNWSLFKQVFLHAFPAPIQPTNIDYLAQLLSRKQGEDEPVGKFVQDINRLCLKLDTKINEQDQLQYLRRGLRPPLQHYALSITSLREFLPIMQHHERIEKAQITKNPSVSLFRSSPNKWSHQQRPRGSPTTPTSNSSGQQQSQFNQQQQSQFNQQQQSQSNQQQQQQPGSEQTSNYPSRPYYHRQQNSYSTNYEPTNYAQGEHQLLSTRKQSYDKNYGNCYQCNQPGHYQRDCPDLNPPESGSNQYFH